MLAIQQAIQGGDLAGAARLVEEALEQHPKDGGLLNLRGIVHAQRNEIQQAHKDFAEAVRIEPGLIPGWQNLARVCQLETESVSCAISSWEHVLRLEPGDQEAHGSLSLIFEKQGKYAQSLAESEKLAGGQAARTATLAIRCADLCALGRPAEANRIASELASRSDFSGADFDVLRRALKSPGAAAVVVTLVEGLDARHVSSLESLRRLAIAYEQLQRPADARKTLERVAVQDPANTAHLLELARLADAAKDYEGALGYLAHARDLDPKNPQIHFLFATIAIKMDLPIEARHSLDRALELDPENPDYNYAMGSVILATRDAATASSYFKKFVKTAPANPNGHFALGIAYFASGDYASAKEQMQGIATIPKTAGGAEYFLGRIARLENDLNGAAKHLQRSIELMPSFSESHTELARVLMLEEHIDEAHAEVDRALRLDPTSFQANERLLVLYRRTHDPRADQQAQLLKELDEERSKRAELMLRTIEVRP
ncbi:MAG TPA: tetratricopeptide repeat protein [Bryobacteraceae bacterium]|nr:tetratricopeptide repeat protein [Bryobacteraceae bacterium]